MIPEFTGLSDSLITEVEGPRRSKILVQMLCSSLSTENQAEIDFIREANICVFVFSFDSKTSLEAINGLFQKLKNMSNNHNMLQNVFIVGNKSDVETREVTDADIAAERTRVRPLNFFELSAKTGEGTQAAFSNICKRRVRGMPIHRTAM